MIKLVFSHFNSNVNKIFKDSSKKYLPYIFLVLFTLIFFNKLFLPLSMFATPGDIIYFNFPLKYFLSEALKSFQLPLWTSQIGTGFPVLADGPIGAFYLPNLLLFSSLPPILAFNLTNILVFLTAAIGTFMLCRNYKLSLIASLYAALAFSFSGFFIARIIHTSFIQVAALLPFSILLIEKFITSDKKIYLLSFAFITSQSIFAGYPQGLLYSLSIISVYTLLRLKFQNYSNSALTKKMLIFFVAVAFSLFLAAAQILPSYELLNLSARSSGLNTSALYSNSGSLKILLLFFNPFLFGNISEGDSILKEIGFYWENIAYSGLLTPFLAIFSIFFVKKNRRIVFIFLSILLISTLLAIGRNGPLHIVFDIPPFNFFRIPSRILYITSFAIAVLSAFSIDQLSQKKLRIFKFVFPIIILSLISIDIFKNWYGFNIYIKEGFFSLKPNSFESLEESVDSQSRISSLWPYLKKPMPKTAWRNYEQFYPGYLNYMYPNSNILYDIPSSDYYTSLITKRVNLIQSILFSNTSINSSTEAEIKLPALNLLRIQGVKNLLSPYTIDNSQLNLTATLTDQKQQNTYIYNIENTIPRIRVLNNYELVSTKQDAIERLSDDTANFGSIILLEIVPPAVNTKATNYKISNIVDEQNNLTFNVEADSNGYLVVADSYYPGWEAFIDDNITEIYPANINSRMVFLPKGNHVVKFRYLPNTLTAGIKISTVSHFALVLLLVFRKKLKLA